MSMASENRMNPSGLSLAFRQLFAILQIHKIKLAKQNQCHFVPFCFAGKDKAWGNMMCWIRSILVQRND